MTTRYKLTNSKMQTLLGFQWTPGEWKETSGEGELCGSGWLHCYTSPALAAMLHVAHVVYDSLRLWECEVDGRCKSDRGLKEGWTRMRITREIPMPTPDPSQYVYFAIQCARKVCDDKEWVAWADKWVSGEDRSIEAVRDARNGSACLTTWLAAWAVEAAADLSLSKCMAANAAYETTRNPEACIDLQALAEEALAWRDPTDKEEQ